MMISEQILASVQASFGRRMSAWESGEHTIIATAFSLEDSTPVTLYVSQIGDDVYNVTDGGLAAGALADAGVDLASKVAGSSFHLLQQSLRRSPAFGDTGEWDLAASCTNADLGDAIVELSEAVIRAEGLKALARRRAVKTFSDRIVRSAGEVGLKIEPQAALPLRYKNAKRRVTFHLIGEHHDSYVQSISRASAMGGYDHARALFADADVDNDRLMTAVEGNVRLEAWQIEGLSEVSRLVLEPDLERQLALLAA